MNSQEVIGAAASSDIFGDADDISSGSDGEVVEKKVLRKVEKDDLDMMNDDDDDNAMQVF
jgi:hypothetical protein